MMAFSQLLVFIQPDLTQQALEAVRYHPQQQHQSVGGEIAAVEPL
jgi:hypothetical protein